MVMVKVPWCMSWLDAYDEPLGDLDMMEDEAENPSPQSTPQVLPSFDVYALLMTYPKEVEETIGIPMEVEPFDQTQLEDVGLNTCSLDLFLSSREVPSVDEPEPQLLPNFPPLDVNLGDKRGTTHPSTHIGKTLGWHLEEIHVTWAHLEKKRTRLQLYTKVVEKKSSQWLETASEILVTPSGLQSDDIRNLVMAIWKAIGGNTLDLDSIWEEMGQDYNFKRSGFKNARTVPGDSIAIPSDAVKTYKRRRHKFCDDYHPENCVGILAMGKEVYNVVDEPTRDLQMIMTRIHCLRVESDSMLILDALKRADEYIKMNKQQKRIVVFDGGPVYYIKHILEKIGKELKDQGVAVDVVNFGDHQGPKPERCIGHSLHFGHPEFALIPGLSVTNLDVIGVIEDEETFRKLCDQDSIGHSLHFGHPEFALIPGLPFGTVNFGLYASDLKVIPRALGWSKKSIFKKSDCCYLFAKESSTTTDIRPTIAEYESSWWIHIHLEKSHKRAHSSFRVSSSVCMTDIISPKQWLKDEVICELNVCIFKLETIIQVLACERNKEYGDFVVEDELILCLEDEERMLLEQEKTL
ncbi:ribonuclease H-like domain-containing protein [Tanacetum coccineum]